MAKLKGLMFGDRVKNLFTQDGHPHYVGIFVEHVRRTGKTNPGHWLRLTNGRGEFWMLKNDDSEVEKVN